jgi:two-component system sensor histidine kinase/response regulator
MNVLVVDNDMVQLESLRRGLRTRGYQVIEASSSEEVLKHFTHSDMTTVDLILSDYVMPRLNGIELLKKIRQNHSSLPFILMTAYGDKDLVIEALRNRCNGFIEKPFTLDQLMEEIERVTK